MARSGPVEYFDRYRREVRTEEIYGEPFLRWACETSSGRATTRALVSRAVFSRIYGRLMDRPSTRAKIRPFIERYGIATAEFLDPPESFATFNEFFFRKLKPGARPLAAARGAALFPADGRHLALPDLSGVPGFYAKGQRFDLAAFLGDAALAGRYRHGALVLSRLCPVDYHRFHFPLAGTPSGTRAMPGPLFSVNPIALRRNLAILWTNKRALTVLDTPDCGAVLIVEIGATNVGSIEQSFSPGVPVAPGAEKGFFRFGGSAIATLFEPGRVALAADLLEQSAQHRELYAHVGDLLGTVA